MLIVLSAIVRADGDRIYSTNYNTNSHTAIIFVDDYKITYKMYLMPHIRMDASIVYRSIMAPADVKAQYKFEGTVELNGKIVATLFRISAKKFISLASTMELKGDPVVSFRSHGSWTDYHVGSVEPKNRKARDFDGNIITVVDNVYTVYTQKTERINMRVQGKRSSHMIVPLKTKPYRAIWTHYVSPLPKDLSGTWVEVKE